MRPVEDHRSNDPLGPGLRPRPALRRGLEAQEDRILARLFALEGVFGDVPVIEKRAEVHGNFDKPSETVTVYRLRAGPPPIPVAGSGHGPERPAGRGAAGQWSTFVPSIGEIRASIASRVFWSLASRFRRSNGSVLLLRTLHHHPPGTPALVPC